MNANRRSVAPVRKLVAAVLGTIAVFVMVFGLGMTSWPIVALGAAMLVLAVGLTLVNVVRRGARTWVVGTAHVTAASEPPASSSYGRCELQIVVAAPGLPTSAVKVRDPRVPIAKWPVIGDTLPVMVDVDDMRRVRIQWDEVPTHTEAAMNPTAAYADPLDALDGLPGEEDLLSEPEAPPWVTRDRQWGRGPDEPMGTLDDLDDPRSGDFRADELIDAETRDGDPRSELRSADLRGSDLRSDLRSSDLRSSDLRGADLRGADLRDSPVVVRDGPGGGPIVLEGTLVESDTRPSPLPRRPRPSPGPRPRPRPAAASTATVDTEQQSRADTISGTDDPLTATDVATGTAGTDPARPGSFRQDPSRVDPERRGSEDPDSEEPTFDRSDVGQSDPAQRESGTATAAPDSDDVTDLPLEEDDTARRSQRAGRPAGTASDPGPAAASDVTSERDAQTDPAATTGRGAWASRARAAAATGAAFVAGVLASDRHKDDRQTSIRETGAQPVDERHTDDRHSADQQADDSHAPDRGAEGRHAADRGAEGPSGDDRSAQAWQAPHRPDDAGTASGGTVPSAHPATRDPEIDLPLDEGPVAQAASLSMHDADSTSIRPGATSPGTASAGAPSTGAMSTGATSTGMASTGATSTGMASTGATSTGMASTGMASTGATPADAPAGTAPAGTAEEPVADVPRAEQPIAVPIFTESATYGPDPAHHAGAETAPDRTPAPGAVPHDARSTDHQVSPDDDEADDTADADDGAGNGDDRRGPDAASPSTASGIAPPATVVGVASVAAAARADAPATSGQKTSRVRDQAAVARDDGLDELITAYPSARPGPAGAIHGVGITVLVTDLDRSIGFYRDMLGFFEIDGGHGSAVLASGDTRLVLRTVHDLSPMTGRLIYLNLEVGDVEAVYGELRSKGVKFVHGPRAVNRGDRLELWAASFHDPDGHNIAITQWRALA